MKTYAKILPLGLAVAALLCAQAVQADQQVGASFAMPTKVQCVVDESGCDNSPGPVITIGGNLGLGAVKARIIFSNNKKGTHTAEVVATYDVDLILGGDTIEIPKQPVRGGVGGNPHIYLQFTDGKDCALSDEFYLGRCVQGLEVNTEVLTAAALLANVSAGECSNRRGPFVTLDGTLTLSGLNAKLIFRNNVKGTHTAEESAEVALLLDGTKITIPKQPVRGGVGGNPLISIQFLNGTLQPLCAPIFLGRCNQL